MPKSLDLILLKVERANEHIQDVESVLDLFFASDPYRVAVKDDLKAGKRLYYIDSMLDIPTSLFAIVGDAIQNLRSSLDHLSYQLVLAAGNTPTNVTSFPIAKDATEYVTPKFRRKIKGMRQEAIDRIDAIKPYKGGNNVLWRLHRLNNIDKHRVLVAAATSHLGHNPTPRQRERITKIVQARHPDLSATSLKGMYFTARTAFPLKIGDVIHTVPISELEQQVNFRFNVAFNEPQIAERDPLLEMLHQTSDLISGIITSFADLL
jgi:hypothetical protein